MIKISASLMCASWLRLGEEVRQLEKAGADMFHLDVMDGSFVPNFSMNFWQIDEIRNITKLPLEVHMMVHDPIRYIHRLSESAVDVIIVHAESCRDLEHALHEIKDHEMAAGVALNVETPTSVLIDYLDLLDSVLFMATRPGFTGQKFRPEVIGKISEVTKLLKDNSLHPDIGGDGHMCNETIPLLAEKGVNLYVGGTSGLFNNNGAYKENIKMMRELGEKHYRW